MIDKKSFSDIKGPSFIDGEFIDPFICDGLIQFFEEDNQFPVRPGVIGNEVNPNSKTSVDKAISPVTGDYRITSYLNALEEVVDSYIKKYTFCNEVTKPWALNEHFNSQWYPPNGGFKVFHTERDGSLSGMNRMLVFMTYLNDVEDEGETEFYYQRIKVKPRKGLTLIWPADWTHTHRGIPSPTQEKIIVTGWYSFY
jgi:hypothetical protein